MIVHPSFAAMESLLLSQTINAVAKTATWELTNHAATTLWSLALVIHAAA